MSIRLLYHLTNYPEKTTVFHYFSHHHRKTHEGQGKIVEEESLAYINVSEDKIWPFLLQSLLKIKLCALIFVRVVLADKLLYACIGSLLDVCLDHCCMSVLDPYLMSVLSHHFMSVLDHCLTFVHVLGPYVMSVLGSCFMSVLGHCFMSVLGHF